MPLPPYLIGGVQLLQVSESWVSSAKRGIRGAGEAAGVGVGTVGDQFLHKGRIERRICVLKEKNIQICFYHSKQKV